MCTFTFVYVNVCVVFTLTFVYVDVCVVCTLTFVYVDECVVFMYLQCKCQPKQIHRSYYDENLH